MENIVLTIGGLIKSFSLSDFFFLCAGIVLIILLVYIIYLVKTGEGDNVEMVKLAAPKAKSETLEEIVDNLENNYEPKPIDLSKYEQEMEDTAIISYDELLEKTSTNIFYDDEYENPHKDVIIKKVDSDNKSETKELVDLPKAVLMSYDNEEKFLKALKKIQSNLVR